MLITVIIVEVYPFVIQFAGEWQLPALLPGRDTIWKPIVLRILVFFRFFPSNAQISKCPIQPARAKLVAEGVFVNVNSA